MHNELITKGNRSNNLLLAVLNRSRELCKKRFEKESIQYLKDSLYNKINISLTPPQVIIFFLFLLFYYFLFLILLFFYYLFLFFLLIKNYWIIIIIIIIII